MLKVITFTCSGVRPDPVATFADGFAGVLPPQAEATTSHAASIVTAVLRGIEDSLAN